MPGAERVATGGLESHRRGSRSLFRSTVLCLNGLRFLPGYVDHNGNFTNQQSIPGFAVSWTHITSTGDGQLLFYDATSGFGTSHIGAGQLLFYNATSGFGTTAMLAFL